MAGLALVLWIGGAAINVAFDWRTGQDDPRYKALSGVCYFAGDARHYTRIALNGYSDYDLALQPPHYTQLNDRGWWPLFPALSSGMMALGGGECSGYLVNALAFVLLVPVFQALTGERQRAPLASPFLENSSSLLLTCRSSCIYCLPKAVRFISSDAL